MAYEFPDLISGASGVFPLVILILVLCGIGVIIAILWYVGVLRNYKYKCTIWEPRAGKQAQEIQAKGDYLKNGKFLVYFGFNDKMEVVAPAGDCIRPGNKVHGFSKQRNDITWIKDITIDESKLLLEPLMDPGVKVTIVQGMIEETKRFTEKAKWEQYLPFIAYIAAALIIMLPIMLGLGAIADKLNKTELKCAAPEVHLIYANQTIATYPSSGGGPVVPRNVPAG